MLHEKEDQLTAGSSSTPEVQAKKPVDSTTYIPGVVKYCGFLNLRKSPNKNSEVIELLPRDTIVSVDLASSTESFYKVTKNLNSKIQRERVVGFCVKEYISLTE